MKSGKAIALAIAIGYVVGERRRLRNAAVLGAAAGQVGAGLARDGGGGGGGGGGGDGGGSAGGDALRKLGTATIAAARTALSQPAERLADRLNERAEKLRQGQQPQGDGSGKEPTSTSEDQEGKEGQGGQQNQKDQGEGEDQEVGAGPDERPARAPASTRRRSLKYAQEITSPDDGPERPGAVTRHHAPRGDQAVGRGPRRRTPATVPGDRARRPPRRPALRLRRPQREPATTSPGDEWFATFDQRRLNFIYQEERTDGRRSHVLPVWTARTARPDGLRLTRPTAPL